MKNLLILLTLLVSTVAYAQQRTISGRVTVAEDGAALPGVSVTVKGTTVGTSTNTDGQYSLRIPNGSVLVFSYIGLESKEAMIGANLTVNISLSPTSRILGEVQVVGSRNANRTRLDSPVPVDVIDIKQLQESAPQVSITQLLQYVSPSFYSVNGSNAGDAGSALNLSQLRGLGVDQVLVLVNGKRRHKSSNVNWGGLGNGATGYA